MSTPVTLLVPRIPWEHAKYVKYALNHLRRCPSRQSRPIMISTLQMNFQVSNHCSTCWEFEWYCAQLLLSRVVIVMLDHRLSNLVPRKVVHPRSYSRARPNSHATSRLNLLQQTATHFLLKRIYSGIVPWQRRPRQTIHQVMFTSTLWRWHSYGVCITGLIPVLRRALLKSHANGSTQRAMLCYDGMVHVATEGWDMGWGCGWVKALR